MMILKFYREDDNWYIDAPTWKGRKSALQMVAGADTLLELIGGGNPIVKIYVTEEYFGGSNCLEFVKKSWFNGADYIIKNYDGNDINLKVWLCGVTKFVLGKFPKKIYFDKITKTD